MKKYLKIGFIATLMLLTAVFISATNRISNTEANFDVPVNITGDLNVNNLTIGNPPAKCSDGNYMVQFNGSTSECIAAVKTDGDSRLTGDYFIDNGDFTARNIRVNGVLNGANYTPTDYIAWYRFDNNSDDVSGNYDGTVFGGVTNVTGQLDNAYEFDASTGYVDTTIPELYDNYGNFSVSFWTKINSYSSPNAQRIIYQKNNFMFMLSGGSGFANVYFQAPNETARADYGRVGTQNVIPLEEWVHVVGIHEDDETLKLYVNNVEYTTTYNSADSVAGVNGLFSVGRRTDDGATTYFNGSVDEITVYNKVLTETEIGQLYYYGRQRTIIQINDTVNTQIINASGTIHTYSNFSIYNGSGSEVGRIYVNSTNSLILKNMVSGGILAID